MATAFLACLLAAVSTASAQYTTYTNADGTIFTQSSVLTIGGSINLSGTSVVLPSNTGSVSGLAAMKVDPYLIPPYANNIWGNTDNPNLTFAPNVPSSTYPLMANSKFYSGGTGDDNAPNANNYTTWNNNTSFVYSGTVDIPQVTDPNGCISFLKQIDDNESLYIDGNQVFSLGNWSQAYAATYSQLNTSWLAPGPHKIQIVMYNGGGGAGPNSGWNLGFGWDLNGDYDSTGSTVTLNGGAGTLSTIGNPGDPPAGGVAATYDLSAVTNSGFTMPISSSSNSVFTSTLVNSFSTNGLSLVRSSGTLNVSSSGATNIFTGGLTNYGNTLSIIGGQTIPGTVQINGPVTLAGNSNSTFDVQNNNTLVLYGVSSGTRGLHKIGSGTLVLGNYNTYNGTYGTVIDAGTLQLNMGGSPGALAAGSTVTVNSGGKLSLMLGDGLSSGTNAVNLKVSGGTVTAAAGFYQTLWNTVNMTGGLLTATGAGLASSGTDGTGFAANYALKGNLNATSNSAGPATISAAVGLRYDVSNSGSVTFNVTRGPGAVDLNVTGVIGNWNTPGTSLTIAGKGITALNNNSYTGGTHLTGGTVNAAGGGAFGLGTVNLDAGTVVNLTASSSLTSLYYLNSSSITAAVNSKTPPAYYNSFSTLADYWSTLTPSLIASSNVSGGTAFTMTVNGNQNGGFPPMVQANSQNFEALYLGGINITTSGPYTFGLNSDDGSTLFIDGNLIVNDNNFQGQNTNPYSAQQTGTVTLSAGRHQIAVGYYQGGGQYGLEAYYNGADSGGAMELIPNSVLVPEVLMGSLQGAGKVQLGLADLVVGSDNTNQTFSGTISGSGGLTKIGSGTLTLAGTDTYTGATSVEGGVLIISHTYGLNNRTTMTIVSGATWDLIGTHQQVASLSDFGGSGGTVTNSATNVPAVLTVSSSDISTVTTFSGTIQDGVGSSTIKLALSGSGTLVLSGTNTYTGGTDVLGGTLILASPTAIQDGTSLTVGADASSIFSTAAAGSSLTAASPAAVPEPGTLVLLLAGLVVGFGVWKKRGMRG